MRTHSNRPRRHPFARVLVEVLTLSLILLAIAGAVDSRAIAAPAPSAAAPAIDPVRRNLIDLLRAIAPRTADRYEASLRSPGVRRVDGDPQDRDAGGRVQPPDTAHATGEWNPLILSARYGHAMIMDEARHRLLIVGGKSHGAVWGDAWEVSLEHGVLPRRISEAWWRRFGPDASLVLDTRRDELVAYGGTREGLGDIRLSPPYDERSATALDLSGPGEWHALTDLYRIDETIPTPRHDQVAIYDPQRDRMIVFGGMTFDPVYGWLDVQTPCTDLWELSLGGTPAWSRIVQQGDVPQRTVGSAVADAALDAMWYVVDGSLWRLDLATARWDSLPVAGAGPAARGKLAFDAVTRRLYCFSDGELWSMDLHFPWTWVHRDLPGERPDDGPIAWDAVSGRLLAFSGQRRGPPVRLAAPGILWAITPEPSAAGWERVFDERIPQGILSAGIYDARRDRVIAVDRTRALDGVYELRAGATAWHALSLPGGSGATVVSLVLDEAHDRMLMNAGGAGSTFPQTWSWDLASDDGWVPIGPEDDGAYSLGWDAARQRVVRFGWTAEDEPVRVQWLDATVWRPIVSVGDAPTFHAWPSVASDPDRGRLFMVGGFTGNDPEYVDRRWTLELGDSARWTSNAFFPGYDPWDTPFLPIAYDPVRHVIVLHGYYYGASGWRYEGWSVKVDPLPEASGWGLPASVDEYVTPIRQLNGLVYDGRGDRFIGFGGVSTRQTPPDTLTDAYELSLQKPRRTIRVDLRPGTNNDRVSPGSQATIQVAALSDAGFDARQLDLATVYVAGVPVRHDGGGRPIFTVRDVDRDGRDDIVVHFDAHDLPITGATVALKLWGRTFGDVPVEGIAAVQVHVPGQGPVGRTGQVVRDAPEFEIAPAPDGAAFECRVANLSGARVELFDVTGRRIASTVAAGGAAKTLRLTPASRPTPGLYFARLTGPATLTRKVLVLR